MTEIHSHKELIVWQRAMELTREIYELTEKFPREEIFGLTSQMRRAAVSIPSNIAEGRARGTRADYLQFLRIAYGSLCELRTQIEIAQNIPKTRQLDYHRVSTLAEETSKMLLAMIKGLNPQKS